MSEDKIPYLLVTDEYEAWLAGNIGPQEALHALCSDLGELLSEHDIREAEIKQYRAHIAHIVASIGHKAEVPGFGKLEITSPSKTVAYDRKQVDNLVADLLEQGHFEIAQALQGCRTESMRAGSLRIVREK